jgi:hypothetical protein
MLVDIGTRNLMIAALNADMTGDKITSAVLLNAAVGNECKNRAARIKSMGLVDVPAMMRDITEYFDVMEREAKETPETIFGPKAAARKGKGKH